MSISENYAKRSAKPTYLPSKASAINSRLSVVPNRFYQRIKVFLRHLMPDVFRFKRFDVDQEGCAMKINTDGVLLGATATINRPARILDIGTGTGVIALMLRSEERRVGKGCGARWRVGRVEERHGS